jgi:hypothetical protein
MREITQRRAVRCRMAAWVGGRGLWAEEVNPMQLLRASAVALPFVGLALVVALLSLVVGMGR